MRTIYLDVLLVTNLYINYLLLRLTAHLTHTRLSFPRTLLGAAVGSLSTLLLFVPAMPWPLSLLCKGVTAVLLCMAAFGWRDLRRLCWQVLCFVGLSCILAGILLVCSLTGTRRIYRAGGYWYPDISLKHLIGFTILAYLLLTAAQYFHDRSHAAEDGYRVQIRYGAHTAALEGLADTGNSLVDFFTGKPVILCNAASLDALGLPEMPAKGFRPLPYTTAAGSGLLYVFHPDEVVIVSDRTGQKKAADVLIGLSEQDDRKAIFNPKLLSF